MIDMTNKKFFEDRRTIRRYAPRHIEDELLAEIVKEASHAPTTGNMQLYSVIATRSKDIKEMLSPCHFDQPSVKECDVVLTFCADFRCPHILEKQFLESSLPKRKDPHPEAA